VTYLKAQTHARQSGKNKKYASVASRLGAELLNVVVDTSGGMTAGAMELVGAIGEESERWSAGTWTSAAITRHLLGAIAVGVQRGNAMAMLCGYTRAAAARVATAPRAGAAAMEEEGGQGEQSEG
jgi:hypothetical protein